MTEAQVPTVGRIVRYQRVDGGREHAAIITDVVELVTGATEDGEQVTETVVDLDIFWGHRTEDPLPEDWQGWYEYDPEKAPGTWSWPERPVAPPAEVPVQQTVKPAKLGFRTYPGSLA